MKPIIRSLSLIILFQLSVFSQCDKISMDRRYPLYLENNSTYPLTYFIAIDDGFYSETAYPDTTLPITGGEFNVISPGEKDIIFETSGNWESIFEDFLPLDTLSVFIFHADTISNVQWERIREEYLILKRYDLSLSDLEEMDWTITYP